MGVVLIFKAYWLENYLLFMAVVVCDTETEMLICTMSHCRIYLAMFHKEGILRETRFMSNRLQVMLCCIWRLALKMSFVLFIEDVFLRLTINKIRWTCLLEECCACCVVTITGMEHIIVCCKNYSGRRILIILQLKVFSYVKNFQLEKSR